MSAAALIEEIEDRGSVTREERPRQMRAARHHRGHTSAIRVEADDDED